MLLNEIKLRRVIRSVILKEMGMGKFKMMKGVNPKPHVSLKRNYINHESNDEVKNIAPNLLRNPATYEKQLAWRLKAYPGCKIDVLIAPSDLSMRRALWNMPFSEEVTGLARRSFDITEKIDEFISSLEKLSINDADLNAFVETLKEYAADITNDKQSLLIYLGGHVNNIKGGIDPPTAFNMLHQVFDGISGARREIDNRLEKLIKYCFFSLAQSKTSIESVPSDKVIAAANTRKKSIFNFFKKPEIVNFNINEIFESRAMLRTTNPNDIAINLMVLAAGWLNPDDGTIMQDNATNPGLAGSSDPRDIVKRCLAPRLKNNQGLINFLVSEGFADLLIGAVGYFWDYFRGRIILTWSSTP